MYIVILNCHGNLPSRVVILCLVTLALVVWIDLITTIIKKMECI
jgi:hypothetical protein